MTNKSACYDKWTKKEQTPFFTDMPPISQVIQKYQISTSQNSTRKSANYCNEFSYNRWREL